MGAAGLELVFLGGGFGGNGGGLVGLEKVISERFLWAGGVVGGGDESVVSTVGVFFCVMGLFLLPC